MSPWSRPRPRKNAAVEVICHSFFLLHYLLPRLSLSVSTKSDQARQIVKQAIARMMESRDEACGGNRPNDRQRQGNNGIVGGETDYTCMDQAFRVSSPTTCVIFILLWFFNSCCSLIALNHFCFACLMFSPFDHIGHIHCLCVYVQERCHSVDQL